jgi:hypothetical protein
MTAHGVSLLVRPPNTAMQHDQRTRPLERAVDCAAEIRRARELVAVSEDRKQTPRQTVLGIARQTRRKAIGFDRSRQGVRCRCVLMAVADEGPVAKRLRLRHPVGICGQGGGACRWHSDGQ